MHIMKFILYGPGSLPIVLGSNSLRKQFFSERFNEVDFFAFFFSPRLMLFGHNSVNFIRLTRQYQIATLIIQYLQLQHLRIHTPIISVHTCRCIGHDWKKCSTELQTWTVDVHCTLGSPTFRAFIYFQKIIIHNMFQAAGLRCHLLTLLVEKPSTGIWLLGPNLR